MNKVKNLKIINIFIIFIPLIIFLIIGTGLVLTNKPWTDESFLASSAVNLVREGHMANTNYISLGDLGPPMVNPLYFFNQALVVKIFGASLFMMRFSSLFWGLVALVAIIFLLKKITDNKIIIFLSLLLVSTDIFFLKSSSSARMDMMSASFSLIALAFYFNLREKRFKIAVLLSNLFIGLSILTHVIGILSLFALIFLVIYLDRKKINLKVVLIAIAPYLACGLFWGIYIFKNVDSFVNQFYQIFKPGINKETNLLKLIYNEFSDRYLNAYGLSNERSSVFSIIKLPIIIFYFICFVVSPIIVKEKSKKIFWWILLFYFLGLTFIPIHKSEAYLCWITPFFIINASLIFCKFNGKRILKSVFIFCFIAILLISISRSIYSIKNNDYQNIYISDLKTFNEKYYDGGKIYGPGEITFYYGFNDNIIQDDDTIGFYTKILPEYIATNSRYESNFEEYKTLNFKIYNHIRETLDKKFVKVFEGNYFTFYKKIVPQKS